MRLSVALFAAALAVGFASPSWGAVRITNDTGGVIGTYLGKFESLRRSGANVIVDGPCLSACTMVLGTISPNHLCVTSRARFGFHTAWRWGDAGQEVVSPEGTDLLMSNYPPRIRDWIMQRGGLSPHFIFLAGQELAAMYPACREERGAIARQDAGPPPALARPLAASFASSRRARRKAPQP
jgi:hypothetical protein